MAFAGVIAGLHLLLMTTACVMCYVSRSIPTKFSGTNHVVVASAFALLCADFSAAGFVFSVCEMKRGNTFRLQ
jgi:hypothetical protein